jgi:hypothetical protein
VTHTPGCGAGVILVEDLLGRVKREDICPLCQAAPDLLAALETIDQELSIIEITEPLGDPAKLLYVARAAIAAAEGGA